MHDGSGPPSSHGAPPGNDNAVGNSGGGPPRLNTNAMKYGSWNDPLKVYERLDGEEKVRADDLQRDLRERSKADLPAGQMQTKTRRLAVLMLMGVWSSGWAYAFATDAFVIEEKKQVGEWTIITSKLNPAVEADFRVTSKERKLRDELRLFNTPSGHKPADW